MQNETKTRLFYYGDNPYRFKPAWPNADYNAAWVEGPQAEKICCHADYICVSVRSRQRNYWSIHIKSRPQTEWFEVDMAGEGEYNYANLAKKLEEHSGRTDLVVAIC